MADQTTITVSVAVKHRLAQAKGERSWDEFLAEVADDYVDDAIALAERRLEELRAQKAKGLTLEEVDDLRATRKAGGSNGTTKRLAPDKVGASGASRGSRGARRA